LGDFVDYFWGGDQFEDRYCTRLAVREATFLMVDSRKSINAGKNETSPTTENRIIDQAIIKVLLYYLGAVLLS
jgi:hypothetical protein